MFRLQAQARTGPGSLPRGSLLKIKKKKNKMRLQAQARATARQQRTWSASRFFIDSPYNIGYLKIRK